MNTYLWDFSLYELIQLEDADFCDDWLSPKEQEQLKHIDSFFEKEAAEARHILDSIEPGDFNQALQKLIQKDAIMQQCIIFSLSLSECFASPEEIVQQIQQEAPLYVQDYRGFNRTYQFEKFSILNSLTKTRDKIY